MAAPDRRPPCPRPQRVRDRRPRRRWRAPVPLALLLALAALLLGALPTAATAAPRGQDTGRPRARVVGETRAGPRRLDLTIDSPALHRTAAVRLLTPDGWEHRRPGQRWPVLWLLHGCCNDYRSWTEDMDTASLPELRHVLVVMPEAGPSGFYSDWSGPNADGVTPAWERFHLAEVRPLLEHHYGAGTDRAVAGLSMGGLGALSYAGRHPGMFRAVASYSGLADTLRTPQDVQTVRDIVASYGDDPSALWGDPDRDRAVWAAHNPTGLARSLARLPVFLSSGDGTAGPYDKPGATDSLEARLLAENHSLVSALHAAGARQLHTDFYGPGTHSAPYWQRELRRSLPALLSALRTHSAHL